MHRHSYRNMSSGKMKSAACDWFKVREMGVPKLKLARLLDLYKWTLHWTVLKYLKHFSPNLSRADENFTIIFPRRKKKVKGDLWEQIYTQFSDGPVVKGNVAAGTSITIGSWAHSSWSSISEESRVSTFSSFCAQSSFKFSSNWISGCPPFNSCSISGEKS